MGSQYGPLPAFKRSELWALVFNSGISLYWVYKDSELGAHTTGPSDLLWNSEGCYVV